MKVVCVYHSADLDGLMSAAIVNLYVKVTENKDFEEIKSIGWDYGQDIPDLSDYGIVILVDISFDHETMLKLANEKHFIWIDHHISAIKANIALQDLAQCEGAEITLKLNPKFAACELTWKHFFPDVDIPKLVHKLGRYDCFGHIGTNEEEEIRLFQYGARSVISNLDEAIETLKLSIKDSGWVEKAIYRRGQVIYPYLLNEAKSFFKDGFLIEFPKVTKEGHCPICGAKEISADSPRTVYECGSSDYDQIPGTFHKKCSGYKFWCMNKDRFNPMNFGYKLEDTEFDGFACFSFNGTKWKFSLYSDKESIDCSAICTTYGGGGHKGAAGFTTLEIKKFVNRYHIVL